MSSAEDIARLGPRSSRVPVYCTITRFGLRSARHLLPTYRDYAALVRGARAAKVPGLLQCAFLVERPTTCYSLSLWTSEPYFSAELPEHVEAARRVFGRLSSDPERGPELWSTNWELRSFTSNLHWSGFDLGALVGPGTARA